MKKPLIIIAGATACGKTETSIILAKKLNGEIISADSMQVYKHMDIGTAKIKKEEMQGINHYLINEFYPNEDFSVAVFKSLAKKYINLIYQKGKIPILVGGTGFYINSVIYDNDFTQTFKDEKLRQKLYSIASQKGNIFLHNMLKNIDPISAEKIHYNNTKKVVRAIEFFAQTKTPISSHNIKEKARKAAYDTKFFVLNMDRNILYEKINLRVDLMIKEGLIDEVASLLKHYKKDLLPFKAIGYKEIIKYLENEISLEQAIDLIKKNTRNFAKRQLTWFKHQYKDAIELDILKFENKNLLVDEIIKNLNF